MGRDREWAALWGLYRYTDKMGQPCVAEAAAVIHTSLRDFCGGTVYESVSVNCRAVHFDRDAWDGPTYLTYKGSRFFGKCTRAAWERLPDLSNATEDGMTFEQVTAEAIMQRSLMFWLMSWGLYCSKQSFLSYDREDGALHQAWLRAKDVTWVTPYVIRTTVNRHCPAPLAMMEYGEKLAQPADEFADYDEGDFLVQSVEPQLQEIGPFRNINSGRDCVALHLLVNPTNNKTNSYFTLPDWWQRDCAVVGYQRMFPRSLFCH